MNTRRDFIRSTVLGATATAAAMAPVRMPGAPASAAPRSRPQALTARHRNLFNGDSCVFFYNPEIYQPEDFTLKVTDDPANPGRSITTLQGGPFSAKAIQRYVDTLADSGIDTFMINANASRAWYPSKVIPSILDGYKRGDREFFRGHAICAGITEPAEVERFIDRFMAFFNLYQDLLDAGVDWLAESAKACRRRGVSPWVSIRMNDFHGHRNIQGSFFNVPLLKQEGMRLKRSIYSPTMNDPSYRSGLNYERPEVRALMFAQIKEVVEDYDFEGLELDWWRQPLCCEPDATPETVTMMTDWFREIRALTERRAKKTGRPYPFGMRIPGLISDYTSLRHIDKLEYLRGKPKHYSFSMISSSLYLPPFELTPQLPVVLDRAWQRSFRLPMCAEPADRGLELVVQVVTKASDAITHLPVSFNGCWPRLQYARSERLLFPCGSLTHHTPDHRAHDFVFPVSFVRDGWNEIVVENGGDQSITVVCIELAIRPAG